MSSVGVQKFEEDEAATQFFQRLDSLFEEIRNLSEFASRKVFRKIDLPAPIDVDKTTAKLENGTLELEAVKAGESSAKKVEVVAVQGAA